LIDRWQSEPLAVAAVGICNLGRVVVENGLKDPRSSAVSRFGVGTLLVSKCPGPDLYILTSPRVSGEDHGDKHADKLVAVSEIRQPLIALE